MDVTIGSVTNNTLCAHNQSIEQSVHHRVRSSANDVPVLCKYLVYHRILERSDRMRCLLEFGWDSTDRSAFYKPSRLQSCNEHQLSSTDGHTITSVQAFKYTSACTRTFTTRIDRLRHSVPLPTAPTTNSAPDIPSLLWCISS